MTDLFIKGGVLMWPILLCSVAAITVILERSIYFLLHRDSSRLLKRAQEKMDARKFDDAAGILSKSKGPISRFLTAMIVERKLGEKEYTAAVTAGGEKILFSMDRGLFVLTLVERIAPLIGFLGTVIGMIITFIDVAGADGPVRAADLAGGIWQALITTAGGLIVAIPALFFHHLFDTCISRKAGTMKQMAGTLMVAIQGKKK
ncbi:MAG: MotA/TolQ/ExbB proton channel family protein [Spirochaetales bacterium]|nr:MotA/TolQ/ExbB proton channel family protein [Spirochaetales bacterium]